jgi:hypothetical protein
MTNSESDVLRGIAKGLAFETFCVRRGEAPIRDNRAFDFARTRSYALAFVCAPDVRENSGRVGAPKHSNNFLAYESALNEEARVGAVATPPIGEKVFIGEESEQLVLARPDREALAKTLVKFAAELGFTARQRRDDLWKRAEARKSARRESRRRQQKR